MGRCPVAGSFTDVMVPQQSSSRSTAAQTVPPPSTNGPQQILQSDIRQAGWFSGLRRIYRNNILNNRERAAIYELIAKKPGIDVTEMSATLGMNPHTLRYHLEKLESNGKIAILKTRGIFRYYENHGRYGKIERNVLHHLWNPTAEKILGVIGTHPGITQSEIVAQIGMTAPTIRWYLRRFIDDGIIASHREGKYVSYVLSDEAGPIVDELLPGQEKGDSET